MKIVKQKKVTHPVVVAVVCDCCGFRAEPDTSFELQEFHSVSFIGGYGSVFGDMNTVEGDFCQNCVKTLLGKYLRITDSDGDALKRVIAS